MPEKKPWSEQEDQVLRLLFQVEKISKWSTIAQKMADEYHMSGRNGKQCRERYQTVLEPSFIHLQWTEQQERLMYQLHDQVGNKWAQIAQKMEGRTDNCVKNHFYSNLRKAIRKLNKTISDNFKPEIKEIRPIVLYKIIEATDEHFKLSPKIREQISLNCGKLKNQLLFYSSDNCEFEYDLEKLRQLALEIHKFSKEYKRKPKKDRRGVAQSMNLMKVPPKIDKFKCASDDQFQDNSIELSQENSIEIGIKIQKGEKRGEVPQTHKIKQVIQVSKSSIRLSKPEEKESKGIQLFLRNAGILYDGPNHSLNNSFGNYNGQGSDNNLIRSCSESNFQQLKSSFKQGDFNLGESVQKFKCSFTLRQSGEIDQQLNLFRSK